MEIINTDDLNFARKKILEQKKDIGNSDNKIIIIKAKDEEFNRKILEISDVNVLLSPENHQRKDKLKQKDSGLNEYLCKLAKKNNIKIAIDLENLKNADKKQKAILLSRIIQNIKLCKRTKTEIVFFPIKNYNKLDLISFIFTLNGLPRQINFSFQ
jgi:RNase P/RNase MRP subunit p30